jgi:hypothetical protein
MLQAVSELKDNTFSVRQCLGNSDNKDDDTALQFENEKRNFMQTVEELNAYAKRVRQLRSPVERQLRCAINAVSVAHNDDERASAAHLVHKLKDRWNKLQQLGTVESISRTTTMDAFVFFEKAFSITKRLRVLSIPVLRYYCLYMALLQNGQGVLPEDLASNMMQEHTDHPLMNGADSEGTSLSSSVNVVPVLAPNDGSMSPIVSNDNPLGQNSPTRKDTVVASPKSNASSTSLLDMSRFLHNKWHDIRASWGLHSNMAIARWFGGVSNGRTDGKSRMYHIIQSCCNRIVADVFSYELQIEMQAGVSAMMQLLYVPDCETVAMYDAMHFNEYQKLFAQALKHIDTHDSCAKATATNGLASSRPLPAFEFTSTSVQNIHTGARHFTYWAMFVILCAFRCGVMPLVARLSNAGDFATLLSSKRYYDEHNSVHTICLRRQFEIFIHDNFPVIYARFVHFQHLFLTSYAETPLSSNQSKVTDYMTSSNHMSPINGIDKHAKSVRIEATVQTVIGCSKKYWAAKKHVTTLRRRSKLKRTYTFDDAIRAGKLEKNFVYVTETNKVHRM